MEQIKKRVWGYCRCGGGDQTKIENQVEQLKQYAESQGYTFLGCTEGHRSSLETDSSEMAEIEWAAKEWDADTLIISDVARLSRKVDQLIGSLKYIAQIPMNVECINGVDLSAYGPLNNPEITMSKYIDSIEAKYQAEYEMDCNFDLIEDNEELGR